jgi:hypothetical protein
VLFSDITPTSNIIRVLTGDMKIMNVEQFHQISSYISNKLSSTRQIKRKI